LGGETGRETESKHEKDGENDITTRIHTMMIHTMMMERMHFTTWA
jgi:hypothetical protein